MELQPRVNLFLVRTRFSQSMLASLQHIYGILRSAQLLANGHSPESLVSEPDGPAPTYLKMFRYNLDELGKSLP